MGEQIIRYDSDEAAVLKTVEAWVTNDGILFKEEARARYHGCTHKVCECGELMPKYKTICDVCSDSKSDERYFKRPFIEWDMVTPVFDGDTFLFSSEEVEDYLAENELEPEDLRLVLCEPNSFYEISDGYWEDIMPEDGDGELPKVLREKLDELNAVIGTLKPCSWGHGKYRTEYKR